MIATVLLALSVAGLDWKVPSAYVRIDGDVLTVDIPAANHPGTAMATATVPRTWTDGKGGLLFSVEAWGEGLAKPVKPYLGLKSQVHWRDSRTGREEWTNVRGRIGGFARTRLFTLADFGDAEPDSAQVQLGLQGTSGRVSFDLSTFLFYGFFPREAADRRRVLSMMRKGDTRTYAFYESPKRIMSVIDFFIEQNAGLKLCLCNDMTKLHEMTFRGTPQEVKDALLAKGNYDKGEYVAVVEISEDYIFNKVEHTVSAEAMLVDAMVGGLSAKEAVAAVLNDENNSYSKNELKAAALHLKWLTWFSFQVSAKLHWLASKRNALPS